MDKNEVKELFKETRATKYSYHDGNIVYHHLISNMEDGEVKQSYMNYEAPLIDEIKHMLRKPYLYEKELVAINRYAISPMLGFDHEWLNNSNMMTLRKIALSKKLSDIVFEPTDKEREAISVLKENNVSIEKYGKVHFIYFQTHYCIYEDCIEPTKEDLILALQSVMERSYVRELLDNIDFNIIHYSIFTKDRPLRVKLFRKEKQTTDFLCLDKEVFCKKYFLSKKRYCTIKRKFEKFVKENPDYCVA